MGRKHELSRIAGVPTITGADNIAVVESLPGSPVDGTVYIFPGEIGGGGGSVDSGMVTLSSQWQPEKALYPLPAASPAPLTTDGGIVDGGPVTTGLKFVNWADPCFNYQGNSITPAGPGLNSAMSLSTNQVVQNASTPRKYTFGALNGEFVPSTMDFTFCTDSTRVIPIWVYYGAYNGGAYTDAHMLVEHDGEMKHLSSSNSTLDGMPRTSNSAGASIKRRELTFSQRRFRRMRLILPGYCYFAGMYVDTLATVRRPPNRLLFMCNGDSWNEPNGASFSGSDSPGTGFPSSSYQCLGLPQYLSFETGQCFGTYAQGATGEEAANGVSGGNASTYNGTSFSAMWSDSRIYDIVNKFSPQFPIQIDIGGWNDGNLLGTPYQTTYQNRVTSRYTKLFNAVAAAGREIKAVMVTIQPVDWVAGDGGFRDLSTQGQIAAAAAFPGQVLGSVNIGSMWDNRTTAGQRSILCLPQSGVYIHLNVSGNVSVAGHLAAAIGDMQCSAAYLEKARQA